MRRATSASPSSMGGIRPTRHWSPSLQFTLARVRTVALACPTSSFPLSIHHPPHDCSYSSSRDHHCSRRRPRFPVSWDISMPPSLPLSLSSQSRIFLTRSPIFFVHGIEQPLIDRSHRAPPPSRARNWRWTRTLLFPLRHHNGLDLLHHVVRPGHSRTP